ncbi:unnamed protein product, partial [Mesorhabditis spiculigera]
MASGKWLLLLAIIYTASAVDECGLCVKMAQYVVSLEGQTYANAKAKAEASLKNFNAADKDFLSTLIKLGFRKLYMDANHKATGMNTGTTCADLGYCDSKGGFKPTGFSIVDSENSFWNSHSQINNVRDKTIIVVHHTVDATLKDSLAAMEKSGLSVQYIVDRDGKIYRLVDDFHRAWHAGAGVWRGDGCAVDDTNSRSVGIETVNTGGEPFPAVQVKALHELIGYLRTKWHVAPQNIIAHHENSPWQKYDISGYFSWKSLYDEFGEVKALWTTKLSPAEQKEVVVSGKKPNAAVLKEVQQKLYDIGHGWVHVGDGYETSTTKVTTAMAIQSFNRKWCPEIFIKESVKNGEEVLHWENTQTYKLTIERLNWLHTNLKIPGCTNY